MQSMGDMASCGVAFGTASRVHRRGAASATAMLALALGLVTGCGGASILANDGRGGDAATPADRTASDGAMSMDAPATTDAPQADGGNVADAFAYPDVPWTVTDADPPGTYVDPTDYAPTDDPDVGPDCMSQCSADPLLAGDEACGSDHMTHPMCAFICNTAPGVEFVPGACAADGSPPASSPPFTNTDVCNWVQVPQADGSSQWTPVTCPTQLDEVPLEGQDVRSSPTQVDLPTGAEAPVAPRPATTMDVPDHRVRFGAPKQQGYLGACSTFGSTAGLEGAVAAALGAPTSLAESGIWYHYCRPNLGQAQDALALGTTTTAEAMRLGVGFDVSCGEGSPGCMALPATCFNAANVAWNTCHQAKRPIWMRDWMAGQEAARACNLVPTQGRPDGAVSAQTTLGTSTQQWLAAQTTLIPMAMVAGRRELNPDDLARVITDGADVVGAVYTNASFGDGGATIAGGTGCGGRTDGVITDEQSRTGGHVVAFVGVVQRSGMRYFVIRNSWGPCMGDHGYFYVSDQFMRHNGMGPFFSINANCGAQCRAGAQAPCPGGEYRHSVDGTCRSVCTDGGLSLPDGTTCPETPPTCGTGRIRDVSNVCVRACSAAAQQTTTDGVTTASIPAVSSWTYPNGYVGRDTATRAALWTCSNADGCRLDCAAPYCCIGMTQNGPVCSLCN